MRRRIVALAIGAALCAATAGLAGPDAEAQQAAPILGSGSTFAEVALDQWAADVNNFLGLSVDYAGIGSRGGLQQFQQNAVDFASSDVPYAETDPISRPFAYLPIVAGGTALMYNVFDTSNNRVTTLRLSPRTIAQIFFGEIRDWSDQRIAAENPDLAGRLAGEIRLAVRAPGSGTTGVFTDFLSTAAPDLWNDFVARGQVTTQAGGNYTTDWPASGGSFLCHCTAFAGSNEIAQYIARDTPGSRGAIGYAETAYALQLGLPVVAVRNEAGLYRLPTARNVAVALLEAVRNGDGTQNLENVHVSRREEAYPISSYNYLVIPTSNVDPAIAQTIGLYLIYSVTEGQGKADFLGYSPLPPNLVQFAFDSLASLPGAPAAPPLGDWGRAYEQLDTQVIIDVPEQPDFVNENPGAPGAPDPGAVEGANPDDPANPGASGNPANPSAGPAGNATQTPGATTTTSTTVAGSTARRSGPTVTSIAEDGSIVYLDPDQLSRGNQTIGLARGLEYEDGVLVSKDGVPVPKVSSIGTGELLALVIVVVGLVLLPPLVAITVLRRRADTAGESTAA